MKMWFQSFGTAREAVKSKRQLTQPSPQTMSSDVSSGVNHPTLPLSFTRAPSDSELALVWSTFWGELLPTIISDQLDHWHPFLRLSTAMAFNKLSLLPRGSETLLIRREYRELTKDLEQDTFGLPNRKLLTGHPGIGSCYGLPRGKYSGPDSYRAPKERAYAFTIFFCIVSLTRSL